VRRRIGAAVWSYDRASMVRSLDDLRERLGGAAFAAAWVAGRVMSLGEAIGYALEQRRPRSAEWPPGHAHDRA